MACGGWLLASSGAGTSRGREEAPGLATSIVESHVVQVRRPAGSPRVTTGKVDLQGQPVTVSCASCHATTKPDPSTRSSAALNEFHQKLQFNHGDLSCLSCHNAGNYDTLRRADGTSIGYPDVMDLCGQCHGPQLRDYRNGAHGGMTGHWDLTRGGRERNNCIDCHDPHTPKYPVVQPVFPPGQDLRRTKGNPRPSDGKGESHAALQPPFPSDGRGKG